MLGIVRSEGLKILIIQLFIEMNKQQHAMNWGMCCSLTRLNSVNGLSYHVLSFTATLVMFYLMHYQLESFVRNQEDREKL